MICEHTHVHAAWHDSGTYNKELGTGGATGTIRFEPEMSAPPNAGLKIAYNLLNKIKKAHPDVTWADLYQLGSATAIEVPSSRCELNAVNSACTIVTYRS